jgi:hypothetical protein
LTDHDTIRASPRVDEAREREPGSVDVECLWVPTRLSWAERLIVSSQEGIETW